MAVLSNQEFKDLVDSVIEDKYRIDLIRNKSNEQIEYLKHANIISESIDYIKNQTREFKKTEEFKEAMKTIKEKINISMRYCIIHKLELYKNQLQLIIRAVDDMKKFHQEIENKIIEKTLCYDDIEDIKESIEALKPIYEFSNILFENGNPDTKYFESEFVYYQNIIYNFETFKGYYN